MVKVLPFSLDQRFSWQHFCYWGCTLAHLQHDGRSQKYFKNVSTHQRKYNQISLAQISSEDVIKHAKFSFAAVPTRSEVVILKVYYVIFTNTIENETWVFRTCRYPQDQSCYQSKHKLQKDNNATKFLYKE